VTTPSVTWVAHNSQDYPIFGQKIPFFRGHEHLWPLKMSHVIFDTYICADKPLSTPPQSPMSRSSLPGRLNWSWEYLKCYIMCGYGYDDLKCLQVLTQGRKGPDIRSLVQILSNIWAPRLLCLFWLPQALESNLVKCRTLLLLLIICSPPFVDVPDICLTSKQMIVWPLIASGQDDCLASNCIRPRWLFGFSHVPNCPVQSLPCLTSCVWRGGDLNFFTAI